VNSPSTFLRRFSSSLSPWVDLILDLSRVAAARFLISSAMTPTMAASKYLGPGSMKGCIRRSGVDGLEG
jgi:hypothetical protein